MSPQVVKFGGSSLANADAVKHVADIVTNLHEKSPGVVVVLSAMGGVTDLLIGGAQDAAKGHFDPQKCQRFNDLHVDLIDGVITDAGLQASLKELVAAAASEFESICKGIQTLRECTPSALDWSASRGERLIAEIFSALLQDRGLQTKVIDATDVIHVERKFGALFPDLNYARSRVESELLPDINRGCVGIMPGYIGLGPHGKLVTLGRGGTDLSATVLGYALNAASVTLYKEVDGILTADPRLVNSARIVPELHYREAAELAYYGAKILHPRSIVPLQSSDIPLVIKNTFSPQQAGTTIGSHVKPGAFPVKALTAMRGQSVVTVEGKGMLGVPGIASRTFGALANAGVSVSVISQGSSEASICFVVPDSDASASLEVLRDAFRFEIEHGYIENVVAKDNQAVVAVVGLGMKGTHGISSRVFKALARSEVNIEMIAQGSSELNISVVIADADTSRALNGLHREFRLEKMRSLPDPKPGRLDLTIFGFGQIGRVLSKQIMAQQTYFNDKMGIHVKAVGLCDSSGLVVNGSGFSDSEIRSHISAKEKGEKFCPPSSEKNRDQLPIAVLKEKVWSLPTSKGVLVDLTAGETAPLLLEAITNHNHVVLANKKPLAVNQEKFDELFESARAQGVWLRYEATVGAGLPVLDTLAKLREAGDEIQAVSGCLSGTLGYLMSEIQAGSSFSAAVKKAHDLGYTEPDPREDLCGMDVARKALILARTLGIKINMEDLAVESLFPQSASHDNPATFCENLKSVDGEWSERIQAASRDNKVLRYVASIQSDVIKVGIEAVDLESPLGRLQGTDNQINIQTKRYHHNPLIVTGPGAGAEVTAAGVLNDILAIATAYELN